MSMSSFAFNEHFFCRIAGNRKKLVKKSNFHGRPFPGRSLLLGLIAE